MQIRVDWKDQLVVATLPKYDYTFELKIIENKLKMSQKGLKLF